MANLKEIIKEGNEKKEIARQNALLRDRRTKHWIDAYMDYTREQESTDKIRRWVAISSIAAALERKVWLDLGYFQVFPNLYTFIIGESGKIRKSTSTGLGASLVKKLPNIHVMTERLTDRSLIDQMHKSVTTFHVDGKDYKQSALFAYASELNVFMREVGGPIIELLTDFWDCREKWRYQTRDELLSIDNTCLNILGASTPTWLQRSIPVEDLEGGFASRVLFVVELNEPDRINAFPLGRTAELKRMEKALLEDLEQIHALAGEFDFTAEARVFFERWYLEHRRNGSKNLDPRFAGYAARKPVSVWKVAMTLAVAESNDLVGDIHHIEEAIELLDEIEETMPDAFGSSGTNKLAKGIGQIRTILMQRGAISHKEIMQLCWRDYTGPEIKQIMEDLKEIEGVRTGTHDGEMYYVFRRTAV